jgi:osmotically-inducible protein OsmY
MTKTKTDLQVKQDIEAELRWDPKVNAAQIGVTVEGGAISLLGVGDHKRGDSEIATAVQGALMADVWVPKAITAQVTQSRVTLDGLATWNYQRDAAERAVRYLAGVVGVTNSIELKPQAQASSAHVKESVEAALQRQAATYAHLIHIEASGGKVTLTGHASSWQSIADAANTAWAAPCVTDVVDRLEVQRTY